MDVPVLEESAWLSQSRKDALVLYANLPIPPPPNKERNFPSLSPEQIEAWPRLPDVPQISHGNNRVFGSSLEEAAASQESRIRPVLGTICAPGQNKWVALNQALWRGGSFIRIPGNSDAGRPVVIEHSLPETPACLFPRLLVIAETGSRAVILDHYRSRSAAPALSAPVIEIQAGENSSVHYVQIQEWGSQTHHLSFVKIALSRDASAVLTACALGGHRTVNNIHAVLQGEASRVNLYGLAFGDGGQVFESYTFQEHLARRTQSDLLIKTALRDKAYSHFDGLIWIEKGAVKSSAYQKNHNLLLSGQAKADSTPRLEILENDILGCTHGAAVGPVDQEQIFYLQSRGIEKKEAEALVVEGFFEQVLSRIAAQSLREKLAGEISARLRGLR